MAKRNLYILITMVIPLCLHLSCSRSAESEPKPQKVDPVILATAISEADSLFRQREDVSKLRQAVEVLAKVRNPGNRNFEVEWKFAKCNYFLGELTTDEKEAEKALENGRDAGKIASLMMPSKPDGYFWYGANLGQLSRLNPITVGLKSVGDIKEAMNKVIELQPDYEYMSAYDVLAQIEMGTRLYGGSADKAVELLERALQTEKRNPDLRLHLAEAYLAVKKNQEAKQQLEQALQTAPDPDHLPEYKKSTEKARKMLLTKF